MYNKDGDTHPGMESGEKQFLIQNRGSPTSGLEFVACQSYFLASGAIPEKLATYAVFTHGMGPYVNKG